jgi:uncharacterized membrane protein YtjA (UPF0391 family)
MKKNMSAIDRTIRIAIAIIIAFLLFTNKLSGTAAIIAGVVALIFVLTSLVSFCPLYRVFNISTRPKNKG